MKCGNCNIVVDSKFEHAIRSNNCPACGKHIMAPEKLASYISLQELIKSNFSKVDAEEVANLVVANFELKQLFKESKVKENTETEIVEVSEEEMSDKEYDEVHKTEQMKEAKAKLKDVAYEEALAAQYGLKDIEGGEEDDITNPSEFFGEESIKTVEIAGRIERAQRQTDSQKDMLSGTGGFSRTDA